MFSLPSDHLSVVSTNSSSLSAKILSEKSRLEQAIGVTPGIGSVYGSLYTGLVSGSEGGEDSGAEDHADLDISFPLESSAFPSDVDVETPPTALLDRRSLQISQLSRIAQRLRESLFYEQVEEVPNAKVPLVRCVDLSTGRKIDITVGNTHALRNSALLKSFAQFPAVRELVRRVKCWAKEEHLIIDTTNGLLSSYTYTLLAVAFLLAKNKVPDLVSLEEEGRCCTGLAGAAGAPEELVREALQPTTEGQATALYHEFMLFMEERALRVERGKVVPLLSLRPYAGSSTAVKCEKNFTAVEDPYERVYGTFRVFVCRNEGLRVLREAVRRAALVARAWRLGFDQGAKERGDGAKERGDGAKERGDGDQVSKPSAVAEVQRGELKRKSSVVNYDAFTVFPTSAAEQQQSPAEQQQSSAEKQQSSAEQARGSKTSVNYDAFAFRTALSPGYTAFNVSAPAPTSPAARVLPGVGGEDVGATCAGPNPKEQVGGKKNVEPSPDVSPRDEPVPTVSARILAFVRSQPKQQCLLHTLGVFLRQQKLREEIPSEKLRPFIERIPGILVKQLAQGTAQHFSISTDAR